MICKYVCHMYSFIRFYICEIIFLCWQRKYQIYQNATSYSNVWKKVILQNIFYAAEIANLCKRKSENTCTGWCFKTEEISILALNAFFYPHIDHFQLIMMVHSKSLKKQINQFPKRALHILKIDAVFYSKDSWKTVR